MKNGLQTFSRQNFPFSLLKALCSPMSHGTSSQNGKIRIDPQYKKPLEPGGRRALLPRPNSLKTSYSSMFSSLVRILPADYKLSEDRARASRTPTAGSPFPPFLLGSFVRASEFSQ